jgi:hypothetical protein
VHLAKDVDADGEVEHLAAAGSDLAAKDQYDLESARLAASCRSFRAASQPGQQVAVLIAGCVQVSLHLISSQWPTAGQAWNQTRQIARPLTSASSARLQATPSSRLLSARSAALVLALPKDRLLSVKSRGLAPTVGGTLGADGRVLQFRLRTAGSLAGLRLAGQQ